MVTILKILLSITSIGICLYGIIIFGPSLWPILFIALSLFILLSLFIPMINKAAIITAKIMGILSLIAFSLLLLASTIGGSFHMSESNKIIAVALALMFIFGCSFFLVGKKVNT